MFFSIRVLTESDYKYIREDKYGTPVRTNVPGDAVLFNTSNEAVEYIKRFKLVSTYYTHVIVDDTTDVVECSFTAESKKKFTNQYSITVKTL